MALRRNPQRTCKKESVLRGAEERKLSVVENAVVESPPEQTPSFRRVQWRPASKNFVERQAGEPFRFFDLPREIRETVYSYLVVRRDKKTPLLEAKAVIRAQKKRATALRTRERLNQRRLQSRRRPVAPKQNMSEPFVYLNLLAASRQLHFEASECFYRRNWFAVSLDNFPLTTIDTPPGWDFTRIINMQIELQLKDAQRMNSYIDWKTFFAAFPSLRRLRIIPTFHTRYYDWAKTELETWDTAHFIFKAFFRELLVSIPDALWLSIGPSPDVEDNMQLEGKTYISRDLLWDMYTELGTRRDGRGHYLPVSRVVERASRMHPGAQ